MDPANLTGDQHDLPAKGKPEAVRLARLMNVARVAIKDRRTTQDLRASIVELSRVDSGVMLVLLHILPPEQSGKAIDPVIVGRIWLPEPVDLMDAVHFDGQSFCVQTDSMQITIEPYREEHLWVDEAFAAIAPDAALVALYDELRLCKVSLVSNIRLMRSSASGPVSEIHQVVVATMRNRIRSIERRIEAMEGSSK